MGRSEWGVLLRSRAEARLVLAVVAQQNSLAEQQAELSDEELSNVQDVSAGVCRNANSRGEPSNCRGSSRGGVPWRWGAR